MSSPEFQLGMHLRLARLSHERGQLLPRNKFLILAGSAACHAGLLRVADKCRDAVIENNSKHMLSHFPTFADALRDSEFQFYLKQLIKFCSPERAELLLSGMGETTELCSEAKALEILAQMQDSKHRPSQ